MKPAAIRELLAAARDHMAEIEHELDSPPRGIPVRALIEAHAARLLKVAARLYTDACTLHPPEPK